MGTARVCEAINAASEGAMTDRQPLASCPLCDSKIAPKPLETYRKDHVVKCRNCGFTYSLLIPSDADYARVYSNYDYVGEDAVRTPTSIAKEAALAARLADGKIGKVIDIAAGAGRFLEHFQMLGWDCYATEFNEEMCQFLERKGFTTYRGGLFPEGAPDGEFDIVIFTEIIEHINNPIPALAGLNRLLRSGGILYITTPNFASIERRLLRADWGMLMWPEHITYWTPRHVDRALCQAGFSKHSLKAQNISPYRIVQALKKRGLAANVSEQSFSDAAQARVSGSPLLQMAKRTVNAALVATGLGSSIEAIYVKK